MKKNIHPKYYKEAKVVCACGNSFVVGSTIPEMKVEICSSCHPFFTGKEKFIDKAGRVDKFKEKMTKHFKLMEEKQKQKARKKQKQEEEKETIRQRGR